MIDAIAAFFANIALAFVNLFQALFSPGSWLAWLGGLNRTTGGEADAEATLAAKESLMRFVYYGASTELFFVVLLVFLGVTIGGYFSRRFLWGVVRGFEGVLNLLGRVAAWAGLIMVIQQVMIVFLQRIFRVSEISVGPFGTAFTRDLSWYSEELKLYNAIVVCLCVAWTFVQGGHVRVDLVYGAVSHRKKRAIDMFGSIEAAQAVMSLTANGGRALANALDASVRRGAGVGHTTGTLGAGALVDHRRPSGCWRDGRCRGCGAPPPRPMCHLFNRVGNAAAARDAPGQDVAVRRQRRRGGRNWATALPRAPQHKTPTWPSRHVLGGSPSRAASRPLRHPSRPGR